MVCANDGASRLSIGETIKSLDVTTDNANGPNRDNQIKATAMLTQSAGAAVTWTNVVSSFLGFSWAVASVKQESSQSDCQQVTVSDQQCSLLTRVLSLPIESTLLHAGARLCVATDANYSDEP